MLLLMNITVMEIFMKIYDYRGSVIKEGNNTILPMCSVRVAALQVEL